MRATRRRAGRNRSADVYQLTTLVPVAASEADALAQHLRALPVDARSPFSSVPGTHFARLVVLHHLGDPGDARASIALDPPRLLFSVDLDGDPDQYLFSLCRQAGDLVAGVFGRCAGYPGAGDSRRFARWLRSYEVDAALPFATVTGATTSEKRLALETRARLVAFATHAQVLEPEQRRKEWVGEFGA